MFNYPHNSYPFCALCWDILLSRTMDGYEEVDQSALIHLGANVASLRCRVNPGAY